MTAKQKETQVTKSMELLHLTREEAEAMIAEDERIDRMSMTELKKEVGAEEWDAIKKIQKTGTKTPKKSPPVYNFNKRERKPDLEKEDIIQKTADFLNNIVENVQITNISKVIEFDLGGNHYKFDLIKQRNQKK